MENSSSWHRVEPTAMIWQMLAALVFLAALIRALWLPETATGRQLCEAGVGAFLLCFCWELPRVLVMLFHGITAADLPEVLFGFGMCCIGALGLVCTLRCAGEQAAQALKNIKHILDTAGSGLENVVRATIYMKNVEDFHEVDSVYAQTFIGSVKPARVAFGGNDIPKGALVEIDAIAAL